MSKIKSIYLYLLGKKRVIAILILSLILLRILFKKNLLLAFIFIVNETVIHLLIVSILFILFILIISKKESPKKLLSLDVTISLIGIIVALIIFMAPSAYDKFLQFQSLDYISYLNCEHAKFISQQKPDYIPNLLMKEFEYNIYIENIGFLANNFSSSTLYAAQDSIRDMNISNAIIGKILDYSVQNNLTLTPQLILLGNTLSNKTKTIASTTCDILKPGIENSIRKYTDRTLFSVIIEVFLDFIRKILLF